LNIRKAPGSLPARASRRSAIVREGCYRVPVGERGRQ
jgi:hypothetical protein